MKELLQKIGKAGFLLDVVDGELKLYSDGGQIDVEILNEIKTKKGEITAYLIQNNVAAISKSRYESIPLIPLKDFYPLSSAQLRLWILSQFEGGLVAYNIPGSIYLNQDIDIKCFKRAIDSTIERHEILRTVFKKDRAGEVRQWILNKEDFKLEIDYKDFRKEQNKEEKVKDYISHDSYKAFDLEKGPLLRASLLHLKDGEYVFYYNMHHIISDGWSMGVLTRDVLAYYEAYSGDKKPALKKLRIQYKDYSVWQLAQLEQESVKAHRTYWLDRLNGELALLDLPGTKQRPRIKTNNGHRLNAYINSDTTSRIKKYAQENGGSLFIGLLTAWDILMYRYTSQKDIIVGTAVAGREHVDLEDQIGFYINTLVLRNEIDPEENFDELFSRVKRNTVNAYTHQAYPFDRLVEELGLQRDASRSALFDIMLVVQNNGEKLQGPELKGEQLNRVSDMGPSVSKFDVGVTVQEVNDYLSLDVVFNPDIYEREMMERLIIHYKQLLDVLLENPKERISQIEYLSKEERRELLFTFNDTAVTYREDKTVVDLFKEQVKRTPDSVAVVFGETELCYQELDELSDQLASYLQENYKIGPDDLVGIKQERSEWLIISVLGILKAGGAYVPIDLEYPKERINYIEKDTRCGISIDEDELKKFRESRKKYSGKKIVSPAKSDNLAYVIYTSGSTGRPKGVMVEHRNLSQFLSGSLIKYQSRETIVQPFVASTAFDISIFQMFLPILTGGRSIIVSKEDFQNIEKFTKILTHSTVIDTVPAMYEAIVSHVQSEGISGSFSGIKKVFVGGDKISDQLLGNLIKIFSSASVIVTYGPTEATVFCTDRAYERTKKTEVFNGAIIGAPTNNVSIYVLSEGDQLQPVGVLGEICIGGGGLARGYLNQEEITKEKFIANPFKKGGRLYKTGDLGKWLPGGIIEFVGRKDDQVKIRGFRIELGEIEQALLKHEEIEKAAVIVKENQNKEKVLVAYIISKEQQNVSNLRLYLKSTLPEYMLPVYYVQLDALPLTNNGKVNRKALPSPESLEIASGIEYIAPRNEIEEKLVRIWKEILQKENVGVKDDFFVLGGNSITAIKAINQIQKEFNEYYQFASFFVNPTPETFSEYIVKSREQYLDSTINDKKLELFRKNITRNNIKREGKKLKKAIFILSPPRSGSTLLRVILAGNSKLFSPPELELVGFETLQERLDKLSGKLGFLKEGLERALMQILSCDVDTAKEIIAYKTEKGETVYQMYKWLQEEIGEALLVDKTPTYTYSVSTLRAIEDSFDDAYYIHLIRGPQPSILSYQELKFDEVFPYESKFNSREEGELVWLNSHENTLTFLSQLPAERYSRILYEALVSNPEVEIRRLCNDLNIPFEPQMMSIYEAGKEKMTDGLYKESKMLGDLRFSTYKKISPDSLDRWKQKKISYRLSERTIDIARGFGYGDSDLVPPANSYRRIEKVPQRSWYPVSDAQRRLWVLSQFEETLAAYNMPGSVYLNQDVEIEGFKKAIDSVIARHEILRTVFREDETGEIRQWVLKKEDLGLQIDYKDFREEQNKHEKVKEYILEDSYRVFDLVNGPLLRTCLLQLEDKSYVFYFNMHHIISDGWSMNVLSKDVFSYYEAYKENKEPALRPLRIQYKDYSAWQLAQLEEDSFKSHRAYWLKSLSGELPVLDLPSSKQRPRVKTSNGRGLSTYIDSAIGEKLRKYGEKSGGSIFMGLLAAWNVLMYRYTSQRDIITGTPTAGREHGDLEDQIGFYVNTLALRNEVRPEESFNTFYKSVKENTLKSYNHQMYPFDRLIGELGLQRDTSRSAVFDVMLVLQNNGEKTQNVELKEGELRQIKDLGYSKSKFDIEISVQEVGDYLALHIIYNTDVYEKDMVENLIRHYKQLLRAVLENPDKKISQLNYMSVEEKHTLLTTFNSTEIICPKDKNIVELFEEQVAKTPDNVAVVFGQSQLSYRELNGKANQLANYLRNTYKIQGDDLIGVKLKRSEWMLITILGVLKSGGAYVPVDPEYPRERVEYILTDSQCKVVIDENELKRFKEEIDQHDIQNSKSLIQPSDLAYIIYTSGSTGKPKGVMVEHKNMTSFIEGYKMKFNLTQEVQ